MPPTCLTIVSWVALGLAFLTAAALLLAIFGRGYRQRMPIMEAVWR